MAAREDQPQPIVLDVLGFTGYGAHGLCLEALGQLRLRSVEAGAAAHGVDGLEAAGGHEPRTRVGRRPRVWPLLDRGREGLVQRLLGELEAAEEADEGGEDAPRLGAVDRVHRLADAVDSGIIHGTAARARSASAPGRDEPR